MPVDEVTRWRQSRAEAFETSAELAVGLGVATLLGVILAVLAVLWLFRGDAIAEAINDLLNTLPNWAASFGRAAALALTIFMPPLGLSIGLAMAVFGLDPQWNAQRRRIRAIVWPRG